MDADFEALRREATAFIVRITSGTATVEDADALAHWRALSADHEKAFREAARLWKTLGPALENDRKRSAPSLSRRGFLVGGSVAAGAAGIGVALSELGYLPRLQSLYSDYATAIGEQRTVSLPDGSTATLDGGTALTLAYSAQARQIRLETGAAVFDVAPDAGRPFRLVAGAGSVTTADASFAARHDVGAVSVECLGNSLSVQCLGTVGLLQGEGVRYSADGMGMKSAVDVETAAAWRKGLMVFNDRPLDDVVADLNRHRRGKVVIARNALRARRVSGVFHLDRPQEILAHLEETLSLRPIGMIGGIVLLV